MFVGAITSILVPAILMVGAGDLMNSIDGRRKLHRTQGELRVFGARMQTDLTSDCTNVLSSVDVSLNPSGSIVSQVHPIDTPRLYQILHQLTISQPISGFALKDMRLIPLGTANPATTYNFMIEGTVHGKYTRMEFPLHIQDTAGVIDSCQTLASYQTQNSVCGSWNPANPNCNYDNDLRGVLNVQLCSALTTDGNFGGIDCTTDPANPIQGGGGGKGKGGMP